MVENYTYWEDPVPFLFIKELIISTHTSAVAAVDKIRETVLERCFPEVRLQAKLRQYLKIEKRKLFIEKIKSKRKDCQKI